MEKEEGEDEETERQKRERPVIPLQPGWYEKRRQKGAPSFVPPKSSDEVEGNGRQFVKADGDGSDKNSISYGLNERVPTESNKRKRGTEEDGPSAPGKSKGDESEAQELKRHVEDLPDEADEEAYEAMPVEKFGEAMLRGMGWERGQTHDKKGRRIVEAAEFVPRAGRVGLGAEPPKDDRSEDKRKGGNHHKESR